MNTPSAAVMVVFGVLLSGCASFGSVQRADTLGVGNYQVAAELGVKPATFGVFGGGTGLGGAVTSPVPVVDAAFRYGVAPRVDLGVRLGMSGAEVMGKVLLTEPGQRRFIASLAPTVGVTPMATALTLPVLLGIGFGEHELTLGLRGTATRQLGGLGEWTMSPGASLGVAIQVLPWLALMPEVALSVPVATVNSADPSPRWAVGTPTGQFMFGMHFGPARRASLRGEGAAR